MVSITSFTSLLSFRKTVMSSAYMSTFRILSTSICSPWISLFSRNLIASSSTPTINASGENGQPCLIPHFKSNVSDTHPLYIIELFVLANKTSTHFRKFGPNPNFRKRLSYSFWTCYQKLFENLGLEECPAYPLGSNIRLGRQLFLVL